MNKNSISPKVVSMVCALLLGCIALPSLTQAQFMSVSAGVPGLPGVAGVQEASFCDSRASGQQVTEALALYNSAASSINAYSQRPNAQHLPSVLSALGALVPFNHVCAPSSRLGVFNLSAGNWNEALVRSTMSSYLHSQVIASSGKGVAINNGTVFVGASGNSSSGGVVNKYKLVNSSWVKDQVAIRPIVSQSNDNFGAAIVTDGNILAISDNPSAGNASVYIFTKVNNAWVQEWKQTIPSTEVAKIKDLRLALDHGNLVVGIPGLNSFWVFSRNTSNQWQLDFTDTADTSMAGLKFGHSVAIHGSYLVVGVPNLGASLAAGKPSVVKVYKKVSGAWRSDATLSYAQQGFGQSVGVVDAASQRSSIVIGINDNTNPGRIVILNQNVRGRWDTNNPVILDTLNIHSSGPIQFSIKNNRLALYGMDDTLGWATINVYQFDSVNARWNMFFKGSFYESFNLKAFDGNMWVITDASGELSDLTPAAISAPTNLTSSSKQGRVRLSWNASTGGNSAISYQIYKNNVLLGTANTTSYTIPGHISEEGCGSNVNYSVVASNGISISAPSSLTVGCDF